MLANAQSSPFTLSAWAFQAWLAAIRYFVPAPTPAPSPPPSPPPPSSCWAPGFGLGLGILQLDFEMVPLQLRPRCPPLRPLRPLLCLLDLFSHKENRHRPLLPLWHGPRLRRHPSAHIRRGLLCRWGLCSKFGGKFGVPALPASLRSAAQVSTQPGTSQSCEALYINKKRFEVPVGYTSNLRHDQQKCNDFWKVIVHDRHKSSF